MIYVLYKVHERLHDNMKKFRSYNNIIIAEMLDEKFDGQLEL